MATSSFKATERKSDRLEAFMDAVLAIAITLLSCPLLSSPSTMTVWLRKGRRMPAKKHKPEEIIGKLREVEIMLG